MIYLPYNREALIEVVRAEIGDTAFGTKQEDPLSWAPCFRKFCIKQTDNNV